MAGLRGKVRYVPSRLHGTSSPLADIMEDSIQENSREIETDNVSMGIFLCELSRPNSGTGAEIDDILDGLVAHHRGVAKSATLDEQSSFMDDIQSLLLRLCKSQFVSLELLLRGVEKHLRNHRGAGFCRGRNTCDICVLAGYEGLQSLLVENGWSVPFCSK